MMHQSVDCDWSDLEACIRRRPAAIGLRHDTKLKIRIDFVNNTGDCTQPPTDTNNLFEAPKGDHSSGAGRCAMAYPSLERRLPDHVELNSR